MGEMSDCYKSTEEIAIEKIARQRFEAKRNGVSNDYIDRQLFDSVKDEVKAEFILLHGREPKGIM